MEIVKITEDICSFITKNIPWGTLNGGEHNPYLIVLFIEKQIVAYSIIGHNGDGIVLDHEYHFKEIHDTIEWLEVKKEEQGKGFGSILVSYVRDLYMKKEIPICFYAKQQDGETVSFYYKNGAIILDDDMISHCNFLAFMRLDQLEKYFKEGKENTTSFEMTHSNRRICNALHNVDGENVTCRWIWKNDDIECEGCKCNF
ncbi:MAG TPA: hypothetical protein PKD85_06895 [Saprospiraceae bacterium]|nr:hypothetical protein [Saprospiraceae bacterium]